MWGFFSWKWKDKRPPHKELGLSNLYAGDPSNSLCGYSLCAFFLPPNPCCNWHTQQTFVKVKWKCASDMCTLWSYWRVNRTKILDAFWMISWTHMSFKTRTLLGQSACCRILHAPPGNRQNFLDWESTREIKCCTKLSHTIHRMLLQSFLRQQGSYKTFPKDFTQAFKVLLLIPLSWKS